MTSPSFSQIRARAESLYKPSAPQRVIGIRLTVPLRVAELGELKGRTCFFNWCDSALEIRELLVAREADESLQVVLTDLDEQDLGQDLLARFVKARLFHDDARQTLQEHFRARHTDPAVKKHRWLAAMLIETMPPGGYAPVANGVLDAETIWGIVLKEQFGFAGARPDARDLLA